MLTRRRRNIKAHPLLMEWFSPVAASFIFLQKINIFLP
jgi:hypothetical protein